MGCHLTGCSPVPDTISIVLPAENTKDELVSQGENISEGFQVNKIYMADFEGKVPESNMVFFQEQGEHGIWYYENGLRGSRKIFMDYRYGFFEETENPLNDSQKINIIYGASPGVNPISPDGKYVVYKNSESGYMIEPICRIDMETGEEITLMVGDE